MCPKHFDSSELARRKADRKSKGHEAPRRAFELIARKARLVSGMSALEIMKRLPQLPKQRAFFAELAQAAFFRQIGVKDTIEGILASKDPDALTRAYMLYGSSLEDPNSLVVYTLGGDHGFRRNISHEFRGNIRIDYSSGESITRQRRNLELREDPFARMAVEHDAVFYHHGDVISWVHRGDIVSPHIESRSAIPPREDIARLVMPLSEGFGIVDVRGHNLTFGFGLDNPHSTALITALGISNLLSMRIIADVDPLTGLFNKRAFMNFFHHYAELFLSDPEKQKTSLILIEIDRFRTVSDRFGHDAGERVLVACGSLLQDILRTTDVIGPPIKPKRERFAVLLTDSDEPEAIIAAKRCRDNLHSRRVVLDDREFGVTASFGIVGLPRAFGMLGRNIKTPLTYYTDEIKRIKQDPCSMAEKLVAIASAIAEFALYFSKVHRNAISTPRIEGEELNAKLHK